MTGLSNDNPFRDHQLIQDTILEDDADKAFYGTAEQIEDEGNLGGESEADEEENEQEAYQPEINYMPYEGDMGDDQYQGEGDENREDQDEEPEEYGEQHRFISHQLGFVPRQDLADDAQPEYYDNQQRNNFVEAEEDEDGEADYQEPIQSHNFVSHNLVLTPRAFEDETEQRDLGSTIRPQTDHIYSEKVPLYDQNEREPVAEN